MPTINFEDNVTPVPASWLNDIDYLVFDIFNYVLGQTNLEIAPPVDIGSPGLEASGINVNGVTYTTALRVNDIGGANAAQFVIHRHSTTLAPLVLGARTNDDTSSHTAVTAGQQMLSMLGSGYTGTHYDLFGGMDVVASALGTISATSSPGKLVFYTTPDASNTMTEAMNIDADGTVNIAAGGKLTADRTTEDAAFINFKATADGDATSAISTFTTSAATTHHIQIEINGTTAWIAASTTDPTT